MGASWLVTLFGPHSAAVRPAGVGGEEEEGGSLRRWEQMEREVIPSDARGL